MPVGVTLAGQRAVDLLAPLAVAAGLRLLVGGGLGLLQDSDVVTADDLVHVL